MALKAKPVLRAPTPSPALVAYTVLKTPENGMKIAGRRRAQGDVFSADPRHMAFLLRESVIAPAPAPDAEAR